METAVSSGHATDFVNSATKVGTLMLEVPLRAATDEMQGNTWVATAEDGGY